MSKIQFINSYGKLHEYNFIKVVCPEDDITVYSDTGYVNPATEEIAEYYKKHDIRVVSAKSFASINNRYIRTLFNLISGIMMMFKSRKEDFDYCFVHYLSTRRAILSLLVPKNRKLVLVTYGSDILRRKNFNNYFFKKMLDRSDFIIFTSGNLRYTFEKAYGEKYKEKSIDIGFPIASFNRLDTVLNTVDKESVLKHYDIPTNKKIVVCGHTSTEDEQYEKMIDGLLKVSEDTLNKCHFVFCMTYGSGNYIEYRDQIERKLSNSCLSYTILKNYLTYEQMAEIHLISDLHLTSITTDALSFFMLEELYAGAKVVYGEWLHYIEFENDDYPVFKFNNFDDLSLSFEYALNYECNIPVEQIRKQISNMNSNEDIRKKWNLLLER